MSDEFASKDDINSILRAMSESNAAMVRLAEKGEEQNRLTLVAIGESTTVISNLAVKLEHQSSLIEASEERNDKRIDKLETEAKEDRKSASASRKEMHKEITDLGQRLIPAEIMTDSISKLSNKIIGSLFVAIAIGAIAVYGTIRASGA
jgi:Fe2+ transport system protein B